MNVYTDPKLLNVAGAMESLFPLTLRDGRQTARNVLNAAGTDDSAACQFAPKFAPTTGKTRTLQSIMDKISNAAEKPSDADTVAVSACPVKQNNPLTTGVNGLRLVERRRVELPTSALRTQEPCNVSDTTNTLTSTPSDACTAACTSEGENANDGPQDAGNEQTVEDGSGVQLDPLAAVAAVLSDLSPADRTKLAKMLLDG